MQCKEETITVQIGTYSNYVGSHFWNIQNEIFNFISSSAVSGGDNSSEQLSESEIMSLAGLDQIYRSGVTGRLLRCHVAYQAIDLSTL